MKRKGGVRTYPNAKSLYLRAEYPWEESQNGAIRSEGV